MVDFIKFVNVLVKEFIILGKILDGWQFCFSDWVECLCGVMLCFCFEGSGGCNVYLKYFFYVLFIYIDGVCLVVVNEVLCELELLVYYFVVNFVKDNDL